MAKKILNVLTNNIGYKLLALVLAAILWLVVYNTDDPNITKTFNANVVFTNIEYIENQNLYYEVLDESTVYVAVTGKRSVLANMDDSDFTATADMSRMAISEDGTTATVPLEFSSSKSSASFKFVGRRDTISLALEDLVTESFTITANVVGTVADGYALGNVSVTAPSMLKVTGPVSVVEQIASVVATIDVSDYTGAQLVDYAVPELLDADGKKIDTKKLKLSRDQVTVTAQILSTKSVPVNVNYEGTPGENMLIESVESDITDVMLVGSANALSGVASIDIPSDVVNVDGKTSSFTVTIDLRDYLPDGVELLDSHSATITVSVNIEAIETKEFVINAADLNVVGLDENYELTFTSQNVAVNVTAKTSDLEKLTADMLTGSIDVSGLVAGSNTVQVNFDMSDEAYTLSNASVSFTLKEKVQETPVEPEDEEPGEDEEPTE